MLGINRVLNIDYHVTAGIYWESAMSDGLVLLINWLWGTCLLVGHGHEHGYNMKVCDILFYIVRLVNCNHNLSYECIYVQSCCYNSIFTLYRQKPVCAWLVKHVLLETCIPVLTCICGNWFFVPMVKRKSTPNYVHTYFECWMYIQHYNTVRTVVVLDKVITYILDRTFIEPYINYLCIWCDYHVYSVIMYSLW